jgi:hypothetical protein
MCKQWQKSNKSYFREQKSAQAKQKKKKKNWEKNFGSNFDDDKIFFSVMREQSNRQQNKKTANSINKIKTNII